MTDDQVDAIASEDESSEKKTSRRGASIASNGKSFDPSEYEATKDIAFPNRFASDAYEIDSTPHYENLLELNQAMVKSRRALYNAQRMLAQANRQLVEAQVAYRRAYSRAMIGLSGGTEKQRSAAADIIVENEYGEMMIKQAIADEIIQYIRQLNKEIDALTVLSHNMRTQINLQ